VKYTAIRSEGGLIPYDLLEQIANEQVPGQKSADFGLLKDRRLSDEIQRVWSDAQDFWDVFRRRMASPSERDPYGTTETRERWLYPLLSDPQTFGYDLKLQPSAISLDGASFSISHLAGDSQDAPPVHIEGFKVDLDHRGPKLRTSPRAMVQEFLNRSEQHIWGIATNGLRFLLLRDSARTARPTYLEFDLQTILEGNHFHEFALFYRLCHRSRLPRPGEDPTKCLLEQYYQLSIEQGGRVRDKLRDGVEEALKVLGTGFLRHPANAELREKIESGRLSPADYHRQLLRLVYRLLFLMVAEERHLIVATGDDAERHQRIYDDFYSVIRLRERAEGIVEQTTFGDLWIGLKQTFSLFSDARDHNPLGIPPLNGELFSYRAIPNLEGTQLHNHDLLKAIRRLSLFREDRILHRINYSALDVEELGSVYESLLDFQPLVEKEPEGPKFELQEGGERKTTGSYYTRPELVRELIQSALVPVIEDRLAEADKQTKGKPEEEVKATKEKAILSIAVCDPACGSGHFLLEAARRLGRELARIRTGQEEPSPEEFHLAVRDAISHCIYGVDLNPLAVDLCKLALWLESHWIGKPLSFLDHRIKCGNSLVGVFDPSVLERGIPDEAFSAVTGDDKKVAAAYKKRNKKERETLLQRFDFEAGEHLPAFAKAGSEALDFAEDRPEDVRRKEELYRKAREQKEWLHDWTAANLWTAAFFVPLTKYDDPVVPMHGTFMDYLLHGKDRPQMTGYANALFFERRFFHWRLEFPNVFVNGGFDAVIGNPPWDTLSPDAKEFFSSYDPRVRMMAPREQEVRIQRLCESPAIASEWARWCRSLYTLVRFLKNSGRYRLFAPGNLGKGDFNVYRMFVESAMNLVRSGGYIGQVVPEGLYNGANCMAIRKSLFEDCELAYVLGFENAREIWFGGIDSRTKFCLYSARKGGQTTEFDVTFSIRTVDRLSRVKAGDCLRMPVSLVSEFSPVALAIMEFQDQTDVNVCRKIYGRWPRFGDSVSGGPVRTYMREVDMGNDRHLFSSENNGLPVYEGRMVSIFDHRAKGYRSGRGRAAEWEELAFSNPNKAIQPQWYIAPKDLPAEVLVRVKRYRLGFCDVVSPTNERSLVAALIPPNCVCGHKVPTLTFEPDHEWFYMVWLAVANSFAMDFVVRKKISLTMSYTVLDSLPFPRVRADDSRVRLLVPLALRLTCASSEMIDYWNLVAKRGFVETIPPGSKPPGFVQESARQVALGKLEAIVAKELFGLSREEIAFIMDSFPIVRKKDEKESGEYRTRRLVLAAYDELVKGDRFARESM